MLPVDLIMHEYLHKYFENIKKQGKCLSYVTWERGLWPYVRSPRRGYTGGPSTGSEERSQFLADLSVVRTTTKRARRLVEV